MRGIGFRLKKHRRWSQTSIFWPFTLPPSFGVDRYAIHYYAEVVGHELVTRGDLFPEQADHPRANDWYYQLFLGPLQHKIPPITSRKWRRITFIMTSGDRFENAVEINDLFDNESPMGQLYVKLKESGLMVEQFWTINESKASYTVDLAVAANDNDAWLPINVTAQSTAPPQALQLSESDSVETNLARVLSALDKGNTLDLSRFW